MYYYNNAFWLSFLVGFFVIVLAQKEEEIIKGGVKVKNNLIIHLGFLLTFGCAIITAPTTLIDLVVKVFFAPTFWDAGLISVGIVVSSTMTYFAIRPLYLYAVKLDYPNKFIKVWRYLVEIKKNFYYETQIRVLLILSMIVFSVLFVLSTIQLFYGDSSDYYVSLFLIPPKDGTSFFSYLLPLGYFVLWANIQFRKLINKEAVTKFLMASNIVGIAWFWFLLDQGTMKGIEMGLWSITVIIAINAVFALMYLIANSNQKETK